MQIKDDFGHLGLDVSGEELLQFEDLLGEEEQVVGVKNVRQSGNLSKVFQFVRTELCVVILSHLIDGHISSLQEVLHEEADKFAAFWLLIEVAKKFVDLLADDLLLTFVAKVDVLVRG